MNPPNREPRVLITNDLFRVLLDLDDVQPGPPVIEGSPDG